MHRRVRTALGSVALTVGTVLASVAIGTPASAASTTVGLWNLNEVRGTRTAWDGSGLGHNGRVGSDITTGQKVSGATAYRFPTWNSTPENHEVIVPESDRLDPGRSDYAVSVRFRTAREDSNILQKGQSGTAGGYWKIEIHNGIVKCQFRTSTGSHVTVGSGTKRVDDGAWHSVRCGRDGATAQLYVDGVRKEVRAGLSGTINNTWELAIGGKSRCNDVTVGCDFFAGDIDFVSIQT
jgi:hypothetical protein